MYKIITFLLLIILMVNAVGQEATDTKLDKNYYLQKSKNLNTAGGVLLGVGTIMIIAGAVGFSQNDMSFSNGHWSAGDPDKADMFGYILFAGLVLDIVSIPVFIIASRFKKKSARLVINNQYLYLPNNVWLHSQKQPVPSLTLRVNF